MVKPTMKYKLLLSEIYLKSAFENWHFNNLYHLDKMKKYRIQEVKFFLLFNKNSLIFWKNTAFTQFLKHRVQAHIQRLPHDIRVVFMALQTRTNQ